MYDELLPIGLTAAARRLDVEPLEIVRLMVVSDSVTPGFVVTDDHLRKLADAGGIQSGWWDDVVLPDDALPHRQRVRAALGLLLARGGGPVRADNLWRGLSPSDQGWVKDALEVLADEELVELTADPRGVQVQILPDRQAQVQALADGTGSSAGLTELFQG